ncbi:MAG TPA: ABC-F family ATP-binding cassette domain-containing protein, partial [Spirochaetia bacterium]|nr:ABC-F family ATP-binding cassette domain-containing protein [Spirochaetia bacterium]
AETVGDLLLREVSPALRAMQEAEAGLSEATDDTLDVRLASYQKATERFEAAGGYDALERGLAFLSSLGLEVESSQVLTTLSGGELSLLVFARALLGRHDLLILDEPGNHLDYLGLAWLERFLGGYAGTFLVISHNRYLLDAVCRTIWHLEGGRLTRFTGNYTAFRSEWDRLRAEREHEFQANDRKARELELKVKELRSIASSQYNPPAQVLNKLGAAKRKLEEAIDARGERPVAARSLDLDLGSGSSRADIAISFKKLDLSIGGNTLLEGASFHMRCGERVALVGANGCGKSTLLERIVHEGDWDNGPIRIGPSLKLGYLSQVPSFSHPKATILEEVRSWGPLSADQAFGFVAAFLFAYEDMGKRVGVLSGGEQNRLQFARLVYEGATLLILDEPTNHMDIPSREAIEGTLSRFEGTLLVESHDRYFLNGVVDRVVEFQERRLESHKGNFSAFFAGRYASLPKLSGSVVRRGLERRSGPSLSEPPGREAAAPPPDNGKPAADRNPGRIRQRRPTETNWEATIHRLEVELAALEGEGNDGKGQERKGELDERIALLRERIDTAYRNWMESEGR